MRRLCGTSNSQGKVWRAGLSLHVSLCGDACAVLALAFGFEYDQMTQCELNLVCPSSY